MWGTNSRGRASRARKLLAWQPAAAQSLEQSFDEVLRREAKALDAAPGHAAVAAGDA